MRFTAEHAAHAGDLAPGTLVSHLGITFHTDEEGRLCASMPVDGRTQQPMGLLHGGATAALAETLGSVGSALLVVPEGRGAVGIELNVNHLKGVRSGEVVATGELLHAGRTTHVWDIRVRNQAMELCAVCRLTILIIEQR
ncbi:MAG: hotdog fold thioesterase [Flavobacteriales bacterium]|jgi:1,4-dihydroxy-2-naphthoyl-CoA hydrolase|nr:MAG: hotdog fold thioesterase [Flavobacteriales bacterium]